MTYSHVPVAKNQSKERNNLKILSGQCLIRKDALSLRKPEGKIYLK
jgi:hypothetical protein